MKTITRLFGLLVSLLMCILNAMAGGNATNATPTSTTTTTTTPARRAAAFSEPTVTLSPGKATVAGQNVNVRGKPSFSGESIVQLDTGAEVTVIEQINLDKFKADEPRQWAKIEYPQGQGVWIHSQFVNRENMTVTSRRLNLRAGPGENYSVVGTVERGATVTEMQTQGSWIKTTPPTGSYAYIAAMYLRQEATPIVEPTPQVTATETNVVTPDTTTVTQPTEPVTTTQTPDTTTTTTPTLVLEEPTTPPPPRTVTHEGIVRRTVSIQAPTEFALVDKDSGNIINYLHSPSSNLRLGIYRGLRIVVTGDEGLDPRWTNTPVLTIKRIQVLE
jgi:uncharacterized protein YgiM (DUF1202 family)